MKFITNKSSYYYGTLLLKCTLSTVVKKELSYFISKTVSRPDLSKIKGEDAYFSLNNDLGVFDGVGGWRSSGVDVSKFSEMLAESTMNYAKSHHISDVDVDLIKALTAGLESTKVNQITGSSTACLLSMNPSNCKSNLLNLGDSGAMLFRRKLENSNNIQKYSKLELIFETPPQCHSFNFPFQTGNVSDELKSKGEHGDFDPPEVANQYKLNLQKHDIVLLATDGLFDNMYPEEINETLEQQLNYFQNLSDENEYSNMIGKYEEILDCAVNNLVSTALKFSLDTKRNSPFSSGYTANTKAQIINHPSFKSLAPYEKEKILKKYEYHGGKPDDITVTLAMVVTKP